jgi:uncharacterized membrane protein YfcA
MVTGSRRVWLWYLWVALFLAGWSVLVFGGGHLESALEEWRMAAAMLLGSYFAGSTPMGGGVVGFPTLVLLLDQPAAIGRDFSLAIQAVGMTSASILILVLRRPLAWRFMGWALVGTIIGTPSGAILLATRTPELTVKLIFATVLASFGLVQLRHLALFANRKEEVQRAGATHGRGLPLVVGLIGGVLSSLTGVGIDTLSYVILVLMAGAEVRAALYTSVVLMAFTSLVGISTNLALGGVETRVFHAWMAAAPVVLFGAPLGVVAALLLPRTATLWVVSILCVGQFVWTGIHEQLGSAMWGSAIVGVFLGWGLFEWLVERGATRAEAPASTA